MEGVGVCRARPPTAGARRDLGGRLWVHAAGLGAGVTGVAGPRSRRSRRSRRLRNSSIGITLGDLNQR
jgi:hypothetical protein